MSTKLIPIIDLMSLNKFLNDFVIDIYFNFITLMHI